MSLIDEVRESEERLAKSREEFSHISYSQRIAAIDQILAHNPGQSSISREEILAVFA
jgi:hypothetical protein